MLEDSFPACAFFSFFEVESSLCIPNPLFMQDQSKVAQQAETTVAQCSLMSLRVSLFPL